KVLVVVAGSDHLVELGAGGEKVWEASHSWPWCCQGLPDGHRLVGSHHRRRVDEYDAEGKPVWSLDVEGGVNALQRLPSGKTLIAFTGGGVAKVREYNPDKAAGWEVSLPGSPQDMWRLDGGHILVALDRSGRVAQLDRSGRVVWEMKDLKRPFSAQRI